MADTPATLVVSPTKLSANRAGNSLQPSERGVACLSEILRDRQFSENSQTVATLLAILHGITVNTTSGDVLALGIYKARDLCDQIGVEPEVFEDVVQKFVEFSKQARQWNPLAY